MCCNNKADHCLCGSIHVTTGTTIIGAISIFLGCLAVVGSILATCLDNRLLFVLAIPFSVIYLIPPVLLTFGAIKRKRRFLLPYEIITMVEIGGCILLPLISIPYFLGPQMNRAVVLKFALLVVITSLMAAVKIWTVTVVGNCIKVFKCLENDRRKTTTLSFP